MQCKNPILTVNLYCDKFCAFVIYHTLVEIHRFAFKRTIIFGESFENITRRKNQ